MSVVINGTTGVNAPDFSGAGPSLTGVQAASGPNSSQFSLRNKIINGGMQVAQRASATVTTALQYAGCDRWRTAVVNGTGVSGTIQQSALNQSTTGKMQVIASASFTNGNPMFSQRIEAINTWSLGSKTVTVSGFFYQNTGSSLQIQVALYKATATDNFTSTTLIGDSGATGIPVIPDGGGTFKYSYTLPAGAGDNGIEVVIFTAQHSATSKNYGIANIQLEEGSIATPFEQRPYGTELALCQRYYEVLTSGALVSSNTAQAFGCIPFKVPKRGSISTTGSVLISYVIYGIGTASNLGGLSFQTVTANEANIGITYSSAGTTGAPGVLSCNLLISSEL